MAVAAVALAPVAVFAPNGTVVLIMLAGAALALDPGHRRAARALLSATELRLLVAFLGFAALAALWSFDPWRGLGLALRLALLFAAGLVLVAAAAAMPPREAGVAHRGMALGGLLLVLLMLVEAGSGAALTRFLRGLDESALQVLSNGAPLSRGGIALALFLWPCVAVLPAWYGRWSVPVVLIAAAAALWLQPVEATVIAGVAGAAVFAAVRLRPRGPGGAGAGRGGGRWGVGGAGAGAPHGGGHPPGAGRGAARGGRAGGGGRRGAGAGGRGGGAPGCWWSPCCWCRRWSPACCRRSTTPASSRRWSRRIATGCRSGATRSSGSANGRCSAGASIPRAS